MREAQDLIEIIEAGEASEVEFAEAMTLASHLSDADLLSVDPFDGDFEETAILSNKMVVGRKQYADHWTGREIKVGERHRCLRERTEGGSITTTRHSVFSLWMMFEGGDPSILREGADI